jgi:hypothetical protein
MARSEQESSESEEIGSSRRLGTDADGYLLLPAPYFLFAAQWFLRQSR